MNSYTDDLFYAAGLIDGEGTIHISRRTPKNTDGPLYYTCIVGAQMTRPEALEYLHSIFGGSFTKVPSKTKTGKSIYSWRVQGELAAETASQLLPYLKIKREQAFLLLEFRNHVAQQNGKRGRRLRPEDLETRELFYQESRRLNA